MSAALIAPAADGTLRVSGALDFPTVVGLFEAGAALFGEGGPITLDLGGVEHANSAGLVLLLEWLEHARRAKRELRFLNLPPSLLAIARFTNVAELLRIS